MILMESRGQRCYQMYEGSLLIGDILASRDHSMHVESADNYQYMAFFDPGDGSQPGRRLHEPASGVWSISGRQLRREDL